MNRLKGLAAALVIAGGIAVYALADESAAKKHGPIAWVESLKDAQKTAAKDKKVIFVDFYADWCGPCKQMLATTYKDSKVVERSKKFVPVLIDVDKQQSLAQKYQVDSIPTVVFLNAKGKVLAKNVGYADTDAFLKLMDDAQKKAK